LVNDANLQSLDGESVSNGSYDIPLLISRSISTIVEAIELIRNEEVETPMKEAAELKLGCGIGRTSKRPNVSGY